MECKGGTSQLHQRGVHNINRYIVECKDVAIHKVSLEELILIDT